MFGAYRKGNGLPREASGGGAVRRARTWDAPPGTRDQRMQGPAAELGVCWERGHGRQCSRRPWGGGWSWRSGGGGAEKGPRALGALGARAAVGSVRTVGRRVPASPSRAGRAKKQTCVWPVLGICSVCLRGRTEDRGFPGRRCLGGRGCGQHCARSLTSQSPVPEAGRGVSPLGSRPASPTF